MKPRFIGSYPSLPNTISIMPVNSTRYYRFAGEKPGKRGKKWKRIISLPRYIVSGHPGRMKGSRIE
jgi:hypothetical protein